MERTTTKTKRIINEEFLDIWAEILYEKADNAEELAICPETTDLKAISLKGYAQGLREAIAMIGALENGRFQEKWEEKHRKLSQKNQSAKNICLKDGNIYGTDGHIIEKPALLIDMKTYHIHGVGEHKNLNSMFRRMTDNWIRTGERPIPAIMLLDLSGHESLTEKERCYVLKRAALPDADCFLKDLCGHTMMAENEFKTWVRTEMGKTPVDLSC